MNRSRRDVGLVKSDVTRPDAEGSGWYGHQRDCSSLADGGQEMRRACGGTCEHADPYMCELPPFFLLSIQ